MKHDKFRPVGIEELELTRKDILCSGHGNGEWRLYSALTIDANGDHEFYFEVASRNASERASRFNSLRAALLDYNMQNGCDHA